jgi:hypothetical protein
VLIDRTDRTAEEGLVDRGLDLLNGGSFGFKVFAELLGDRGDRFG